EAACVGVRDDGTLRRGDSRARRLSVAPPVGSAGALRRRDGAVSGERESKGAALERRLVEADEVLEGVYRAGQGITVEVSRRTPAEVSPPPFVHGCNYPWTSDGTTIFYGLDFGANIWGSHLGVSARRAAVARDFQMMAALGFTVVRWFVFCDGRAGI